jgi:hypothetical protein
VDELNLFPIHGTYIAYGNAKLLAAFVDLCGKANLTISKVAVDDSEFPYLL